MSTIFALMNQIQEDAIVLPAIQRDFVWTEDQCVALLDSILRGYPIGIVLLWETYLDLQFRRFERDYRQGVLPVFSENPARKKLRVVLDGQQRLQTLYVALFGTYDGRRLAFDVLSGRERDDLSETRYNFKFLSGEEIGPSHAMAEPAPGTEVKPYWIRLADVLAHNAMEKMELVRSVVTERGLDPDTEVRLRLNLDTLERSLSIEQNTLKVSTIDEDLKSDSPYRKTEADVLEIFVRINRQGTPLSRSDLVFSMLKLNWRESAEALPEFVRRARIGNSFDVDTDFVVRCMFAVIDLGAKIDLDLLRKGSNVRELQKSFANCCKAISAALDFVQTHCWIASSRLVGGMNTLVPLVYYLFHCPKFEIPNDQLPGLRKMFYYLALAQPFTRYGESRLGAYIRADLKPRLKQGDLSVPVERTAQWVRYWESIRSLDDLLRRNPALTLHVIQGRSGARVQYEGNAPEIDHIFPKSTLRDRGFAEDQINNVANYWILAQNKNRNKSNVDPSQYFKDVSEEELKAARITKSMLHFDAYAAFLGTRMSALADAMEERLSLAQDLVPEPLERPGVNAPWGRDELILALDLYLRKGALGPENPEVQLLSEMLRRLGGLREGASDSSFRNRNGVSMKLANFAALDPKYQGVGLRSYAQADKALWDELAGTGDVSGLAKEIREKAVGLPSTDIAGP